MSSGPEAAWQRWRAALAPERLPAAMVDLDALDGNLATILAAMEDTSPTVRLATKSLRCTRLLRYLLERGQPRIRGLFTFSAAETALLADLGFDDLLLGYPVSRSVDALAVARVAAQGTRVAVVVDCAEHVALLAQAARSCDVTLGLCIDVDLSWRPTGALHFGVRRSPVRDSEAARALAHVISDTEGVSLAGVLAYEAQVAGVPDITPHSRLLDPARRLVKARSRPLAMDRRRAVVETLREAGFEPGLVNGGGTGSVAFSSRDPSLTEVTVGSGFLAPRLFDGYAGLRLDPAVFFALPVVRRSDPDHVTCAGGGYSASGATGPDRAPVAYLPAGLEPVELEGWGEVQTPFKVSGNAPALGDPVICRPAKAGELVERFDEILLVRGDEVVEHAPTYRGLGGSFG